MNDEPLDIGISFWSSHVIGRFWKK